MVNEICFMVFMEKFPGLDFNHSNLQYSTLGGTDSFERFGVGFMCKKGVRVDNRNLRFPQYVFVYVLEGSGVFVDEESGMEFELSPGSFFQRLPGRMHSNYIDEGADWKEFFIDLGAGIYELYSKIRFIHSEPLAGALGLDMALAEKVWRIKERIKNAGQEQLGLLFNELIGVVIDLHNRIVSVKCEDSSMIMVEQGREFLSRDFSGRMNLIDFCRRNGWGYENFRKKFTAYTGLSPNQYRIRRRIDAAAALLQQRKMSIAEIAWTLGYKSPFEFSAQFSKYTGCAPSHFIKGEIKR